MQLDKLLQSQGFGSRKHCQSLITSGHVYVEGQQITLPKTKVVPQGLIFSVFGEEFEYREQVYIALYKPAGYECSHHPQYHHSVFDLFPDYLRVF